MKLRRSMTGSTPSARASHAAGPTRAGASVNRRHFLLTLGTVVAASRLHPVWAKDRTPLTVTELGERLFVISGGGGNVTVFHPDEGVLLVDGGSPEEVCAPPPVSHTITPDPALAERFALKIAHFRDSYSRITPRNS